MSRRVPIAITERLVNKRAYRSRAIYEIVEFSRWTHFEIALSSRAVYVKFQSTKET